jgi:RNA polymerase sigma-70 factor (sigma-E family)
VAAVISQRTERGGARGATVGRSQHVTLVDFVRDNSLGLTRFAYLVTGDRLRAEDVVQDVFMSMHKRFGRTLELESPHAYAQRAIVNAHISWLRRRRLHELLIDELPEHPVAARPDAEANDEVWNALCGLARKQRIVLVLRYYEGFSDKEIAAVLGCREGTIRSLATRAFARLRPVLHAPHATTEIPS